MSLSYGTAKIMHILSCKAATTLFMCLSSVSGSLMERCMKKLPFFSPCAVDGRWKKKQFPQAAYRLGLRSGELWHMRYRSRAGNDAGCYPTVALSSYTTLSSVHRRLFTRRKVIPHNEFVFTGTHVGACSGNQPVMEPTEPFNVIIYVSNLFIG